MCSCRWTEIEKRKRKHTRSLMLCITKVICVCVCMYATIQRLIHERKWMFSRHRSVVYYIVLFSIFSVNVWKECFVFESLPLTSLPWSQIHEMYGYMDGWTYFIQTKRNTQYTSYSTAVKFDICWIAHIHDCSLYVWRFRSTFPFLSIFSKYANGMSAVSVFIVFLSIQLF